MENKSKSNDKIEFELPPGQHIQIHYLNENKEIIKRAYTPISQLYNLDKLDLLIKSYKDNGTVSSYLEDLREED